MEYLYAFAGIAILVVVFTDLIYTTLSTNGDGFVSGYLSRWLWQAMFFLGGRRGRSPLMNHAGVTITVFMLTVWILLAWIGNGLLFCADPYSVINVQTHLPATTGEKFYYAGYTLSTLGMGDFYARTTFWKLLTAAISLSGLTMLTIAITYLLQVVSSEIAKRQLALYIASLGGTPHAILLNAWNGRDFKQLETDTAGLASLILSHSQHHLAYPIIHYFHSSRLREASSVNLAALDEALTILMVSVSESAQPSLISLRKAMTTYLLTIEDDFITSSDESPPLPDMDALRERGVPLVADAGQTGKYYDQLSERRRLLLANVEFGGWTWNDVLRSKFRAELDIER